MYIVLNFSRFQSKILVLMPDSWHDSVSFSTIYTFTVCSHIRVSPLNRFITMCTWVKKSIQHPTWGVLSPWLSWLALLIILSRTDFWIIMYSTFPLFFIKHFIFLYFVLLIYSDTLYENSQKYTIDSNHTSHIIKTGTCNDRGYQWMIYTAMLIFFNK